MNRPALHVSLVVAAGVMVLSACASPSVQAPGAAPVQQLEPGSWVAPSETLGPNALPTSSPRVTAAPLPLPVSAKVPVASSAPEAPLSREDAASDVSGIPPKGYTGYVTQRTNTSGLSTSDWYYPPVPGPTDVHGDGSPWCTNVNTVFVPSTGTPLDLSDVTVTASSYDSPAVGSDGKLHNFEPANAIDGTKEVWRVAGDGDGQWITITFPKPRQVSSIALMGGYSSEWDTGTSIERCNHRPLSRVNVTLDNGSSTAPFPYVYNGMQEVDFSGLGGFMSPTAGVKSIKISVLGSLDTGAEQNVAIEEIVIYGTP